MESVDDFLSKHLILSRTKNLNELRDIIPEMVLEAHKYEYPLHQETSMRIIQFAHRLLKRDIISIRATVKYVFKRDGDNLLTDEQIAGVMRYINSCKKFKTKDADVAAGLGCVPSRALIDKTISEMIIGDDVNKWDVVRAVAEKLPFADGTYVYEAVIRNLNKKRSRCFFCFSF